MSACTARSRPKRRGPRAPRCARSKSASIDSRQEYNYDRPHEAIDQETPAEHYLPSPRELPRQLPPLEYPGHFEVRLVSRNSGVRRKKRWVCVMHTLVGEYVGLEEVGDGLWDVALGRSSWDVWTSGASSRGSQRSVRPEDTDSHVAGLICYLPCRPLS
jgi:hypothetical protein